MDTNLRLRHISEWINPVERGLKAFHVTFIRDEIGPVKSMLELGHIFYHPSCDMETIVWASGEDAISDVLNYHYRDTWHNLEVLGEYKR